MYKVELTSEEINFLRINIDSTIAPQGLTKKLWEAIPFYITDKKRKATQKATEVRTKKAREKINNAINLLQLENKPITHYSISKTAEVSFNTVKKHIPDIDKIGKL